MNIKTLLISSLLAVSSLSYALPYMDLYKITDKDHKLVCKGESGDVFTIYVGKPAMLDTLAATIVYLPKNPYYSENGVVQTWKVTGFEKLNYAIGIEAFTDNVVQHPINQADKVYGHMSLILNMKDKENTHLTGTGIKQVKMKGEKVRGVRMSFASTEENINCKIEKAD